MSENNSPATEFTENNDIETTRRVIAQMEKDSMHFATIKHKDGRTEQLTKGDFLQLMESALSKEAPDAEAAEKLKIMIEAIITFSETQPDLLGDPIASKLLHTLQVIHEYIHQTIEQAAEINKFLQGAKEFMAVPRPAGLEDFLKISAGKGNKEITIKEFENTKIRFEGRLSIDEQKINDMLRLAFATANPYKATKGLTTFLELPFKETMEMLGRPVTADNKKRFSRQLRKEILPTIARQYIEIENAGGSGLRGYVGSDFAVDVKTNKIYFNLGDSYARYLSTGALSQISHKTFRLGTQSNPLPYYLALKLQDQYFHDGNRKRKDSHGNPQPTNTILSIKTLLAFSTDILPSYDYVQQTDPGHWIRRIKGPLEEALNEIQKAGLFSWQYCKKGLAEATPQEIHSNDFQKWSTLYITFKLIPDEPDQTERLEHKQQRIEAAQAKQALKDAETIIQADKIQKRKERKKKDTETA